MLVMPYKKNKKDIKNIYFEAFSRKERTPFLFLSFRAKSSLVEFSSYKEKEETIGFSYIIKDDTNVFIFYLAISKKHQDKGYGSKILALIKEKYPSHTISLFVKTDDTINSKRREAFYIKNGFTYTDIKYKGRKENYLLMTYGGHVSKEKLNKLIKRYSFSFVSISNEYKASATSTLKL